MNQFSKQVYLIEIYLGVEDAGTVVNPLGMWYFPPNVLYSLIRMHLSHSFCLLCPFLIYYMVGRDGLLKRSITVPIHTHYTVHGDLPALSASHLYPQLKYRKPISIIFHSMKKLPPIQLKTW